MEKTFEEKVAEIVRRNMEDPAIRAAVRRERQLGASAHRQSKGAQALENWAIAIHPATYYGGKVK
jgi:hypothetical protein